MNAFFEERPEIFGDIFFLKFGKKLKQKNNQTLLPFALLAHFFTQKDKPGARKISRGGHPKYSNDFPRRKSAPGENSGADR